jgi:peptide/nickel transport system permease protein
MIGSTDGSADAPSQPTTHARTSGGTAGQLPTSGHLETSPGRSRLKRALPYLTTNLAATAAAVVLLGTIVSCFGAALIAPYSPDIGSFTSTLQGPSLAHLLGTDELGRDVLSRLLYGGQISLIGVGEVGGVAALIGLPIGLAAGYCGGRIDAVVGRCLDIALAVPAIIVLLMVVAVFGQNMNIVMCVFGLLSAPAMARVARAGVLTVRSDLYIAAAEATGVSRVRIVLRHVLPRISGLVAVNLSLIAATGLVVGAALNFLGIGVQLPAPSWGGMVSEASSELQQDPWLLVPSGLVIALIAGSIVLIGDGIRDGFALRERRGGGVGATHVAVHPSAEPPAPLAESALLSVRALSIVHRRDGVDVPVVSNVSFDVRPGQAVALVGESGCGKSVLIRAVLDLLPSGIRVSSGIWRVGGRDFTPATARGMREVRGRRVGLIGQDPAASMDPLFTVGQQLRETLRRASDTTGQALRTRSLELLELVGLPDPARVAKRFPFELSGGMAQRVAIARALAGQPDLLIADEPTTALDVTLQAEILDVIRALQHKTGMALLLVTHDWGVVADISEWALVMYAGEIVESGPTDATIAQPLHPYTQRLLESDLHGASRSGRLNSIRGEVCLPGEWPLGCRFAQRCEFAEHRCGAAPIRLRGVADARMARCVRTETAYAITAPASER